MEYQPIENYGVVGDLSTAALISTYRRGCGWRLAALQHFLSGRKNEKEKTVAAC